MTANVKRRVESSEFERYSPGVRTGQVLDSNDSDLSAGNLLNAPIGLCVTAANRKN